MKKPKVYTFLKNRFKSSRPNDTILTESREFHVQATRAPFRAGRADTERTTPAEPKKHGFARRRTQHVC